MLIQALIFTLMSSLAPAKTAKDEFVFANEAEPETLDPHVATGVPDNNLTAQLFEGLLRREANWVGISPGIAEFIPAPTDQGRVYTFKLRRNAMWSDGSPITAEDFVYSWQRAADPKTLGSYSYWVTDYIEGAAEYAKAPTPENAKKLGVKAIDSRTLQVRLKNPVPFFLQLIAEPVFFPVKRGNLEKFGDRWTRPENMVVNGPYTLKEWRVNERIVLEKNSRYWDSANVRINRVVALPLNDKQTAMNLFMQGQIDWSGHNGAPSAVVPSLRSNEHFRSGPAFVTYFYRLNTKRAPLDHVKVRQALALAIDRSVLVDKITRGGEAVALALVPPNTGKYRSPQGIVTGNFEKDVIEARRLLAEAGFPDGKGFPVLKIQYDTKELHQKVAMAIQQMWKKNLGIQVEAFNQEWKVYLKEQKAMNFDISRSGWSGDYPDPATFLELFTSDSGNNQTGYANKDYDKVFMDSSKEMNAAKRNEMMVQAEKMLLNELPVIPLFYYANYSFLRPEVSGFVKNAVDRPFIRTISKR
jgi:oligopeptide transport system substrate-binding protein